MRFLTLTIKDDAAVKEYDFTNGEGSLAPDEVVAGVENALFGNDAMFSGEIILTAEYADKTYEIKRDFALGTAFVTLDGGLLTPENAQNVMNNLAALGQKQWRKNNERADYAAFLSDCASYVEKLLASLGLTEEELEWRSSAYDRKNDRILAQVEVLDELVDDNLSSAADDKKQAIKALSDELAALQPSAQGEDREKAAERVAELESRLEDLKKEEEEYADKSQALADSRRNARNMAVLKRVEELKKDMEDNDAELSPLTAELDQKEALIAEKREEYNEAKKEFDSYDERANVLRNEFFKMVDENDTKGEITAAVMEKTEDSGTNEMLEGFMTWDEKFYNLSKELTANHMDFAKRRSVREGLAFETAIDDMESQIEELRSTMESNARYISDLEEEIKTSADKTVAEGADFVTLYKYKTLCDVYRSEIVAEEKKIRENEAARQNYAEDISALEKAKVALDKYVAQTEDKSSELVDRITGVKARISFCGDVDEMEYGDVCPVCNNRIADKADHSRELEKLNVSLSKLEDELEENRAALKDYASKCEAISARLGQLKEKDRLSGVYVESLNASVARKQTEQTNMLAAVNADSFSALEKMCRAAANSYAGDGFEDLSHVNFLKAKIAELTGDNSSYESKIAEISTKLEDMRRSYNDEILPAMDGKRAYSMLDETVAAEAHEDEIITEMIDADNQRAIFLSYLISEDNSAPRLIDATASVFNEVAAEIKANDQKRREALEKMQSLDAEITGMTDEFNETVAKADALMAQIESDKACIKELCEIIGTDENEAKEPFSEDEENALQKDVDEYYAKVKYIEEKIAEAKAALPEEDFDRESYDGKKAELEQLKQELDDIEKRMAISAAAVDLACVKTAKCDELIKNSALVKKLADGDVFDVILPILNDALYLSGEEASASADGLGIKFSVPAKKGPRTVNADDIDDNVLHIAIDCVMNYVLRLATDKETIKFLPAEKRGEEAVAAMKYGVVLL